MANIKYTYKRIKEHKTSKLNNKLEIIVITIEMKAKLSRLRV